MRSRLFLFGLPLMAMVTPAAAQDVVFVSGIGDNAPVSGIESKLSREPAGDEQMLEVADKMADPSVQAGVSAAVERMTSTMMELPIGQFAAAIEKARPGTVGKRIRRDATVADLAGRDADDLPEQLGNGSRQMMGMASDLARAFADMMPELERMGRDMEEGFRTAKMQSRSK